MAEVKYIEKMVKKSKTKSEIKSLDIDNWAD